MDLQLRKMERLVAIGVEPQERLDRMRERAGLVEPPAFTPEMFADLARSCHDPEAAEKAAALLLGDLDPEDVTGNVQMVEHDEWVMIALDQVLETYGVEALVPDGCMAPIGLYLNTGDTYSETVFLSEDGEFRLTTWGDEMEAWERDQVEEGMPY